MTYFIAPRALADASVTAGAVIPTITAIAAISIPPVLALSSAKSSLASARRRVFLALFCLVVAFAVLLTVGSLFVLSLDFGP